jgi:hypothetical protein
LGLISRFFFYLARTDARLLGYRLCDQLSCSTVAGSLALSQAVRLHDSSMTEEHITRQDAVRIAPGRSRATPASAATVCRHASKIRVLLRCCFAAPSNAASWAEECWALGSGLWALGFLPFWWGGSRQSGASLTLPLWAKRIVLAAWRAEAELPPCPLPAWANVRNGRRCNVRPQGVSNPRLSCFDSPFSRPSVGFYFIFSLSLLAVTGPFPVQAYTDLFFSRQLRLFARPLGMNPAVALRL